MRQRLPSPIRPFDLPPAYVIEAAKQLFALFEPERLTLDAGLDIEDIFLA